MIVMIALQMFCLQTNTQRIPAQSVSRGQVQPLHRHWGVQDDDSDQT